MRILAVEFSSARRTLAAGVPGTVVRRSLDATRPGHGVFACMRELLAEANLEVEDIEMIAVGLGPGSYTGIRSALALAQGWQLAREVVLAGVSSIESLVEEASQSGITGSVTTVLDAQQDGVYVARHQIDGAGRKIIEPPRIMRLEEAKQRALEGPVIGPEVTRWFPEGRIVFPDAGSVLALAARRDAAVVQGSLEPIYLREPRFVKVGRPLESPS